MMRRSFGAIPAAAWIVFVDIALIRSAVLGVLEFTR